MSWQTISNTTQVARKDRQCCWCGERIRKGMAYHRCTGLMEGDFQSNPYHPECWNAALDIFRTGEEGFEAGSFERGSVKERKTRILPLTT